MKITIDYAELEFYSLQENDLPIPLNIFAPNSTSITDHAYFLYKHYLSDICDSEKKMLQQFFPSWSSFAQNATLYGVPLDE